MPNIQNSDGCDTVVAKLSDRRGRMCIPLPICRNASASAKTLRDGSLPVRGQQLFNCLPKTVRNTTGCSVDSFKRQFDKFLSIVPDEPQIPGYTAQRQADSNSLLDMTRFAAAYSNHQHVDVPAYDSIAVGNQGSGTAIAGAR